MRRLGGETQAIVAADRRLVTDATMAETLRPLAARNAWIVMASCYGGGFTEVLGRHRILTAAGARSLAYENAAYGNSYLVEYLFQRAMMEGGAPETVERAFAWAHASLQLDHPNRLPVQYEQLDGELAIGSPPPRRGSSPPPPPRLRRRRRRPRPPVRPTRTTTA